MRRWFISGAVAMAAIGLMTACSAMPATTIEPSRQAGWNPVPSPDLMLVCFENSSIDQGIGIFAGGNSGFLGDLPIYQVENVDENGAPVGPLGSPIAFGSLDKVEPFTHYCASGIRNDPRAQYSDVPLVFLLPDGTVWGSRFTASKIFDPWDIVNPNIPKDFQIGFSRKSAVDNRAPETVSISELPAYLCLQGDYTFDIKSSQNVTADQFQKKTFGPVVWNIIMTETERTRTGESCTPPAPN